MLKTARRQPASIAACAAVLALGLIAASRQTRAEEWPTADAPTRLDEPGRALGGYPENNGPSPRTLQEFVAFAERSHPRLRAASAAVEAARGKAVQSRLYPNPMVAAGSPQIAGADSQWNGFATQDIVTAGKLRLAQQAAFREVQKTEYELVRARFDVLRDVRQSFYALLRFAATRRDLQTVAGHRQAVV